MKLPISMPKISMPKISNPVKKTEGAPAPAAAPDTGRPAGTWEGTGYHATDEEAHRNVVYSVPSTLNQIIFFFQSQMKLFSKAKQVYFMLVMAILIPLLAKLLNGIEMGGYSILKFLETTMALPTGTGEVGLLLSFLPFFLALLAQMLCGKQISTELTERTAYMNFALPSTRLAFCVGKYLAGFVVCLGVFIFAYAMALLTAMSDYPKFESALLGKSILMMFASVFAFTQIQYGLGCILKRANVFLPFVFMLFIMPIIVVILNNYTGLSTGALLTFPCCSADVAVTVLGSSVTASPLGMFGGIASGLFSFYDGQSIMPAFFGAIVWGLGFFALGTFKVMRREM